MPTSPRHRLQGRVRTALMNNLRSNSMALAHYCARCLFLYFIAVRGFRSIDFTLHSHQKCQPGIRFRCQHSVWVNHSLFSLKMSCPVRADSSNDLIAALFMALEPSPALWMGQCSIGLDAPLHCARQQLDVPLAMWPTPS